MPSKEKKRERKQVFKEIVGAFEKKYSWWGHQLSREMLLSLASWHIEKHTDHYLRMRNHLMIYGPPGWGKSTMLRKMREVLGEELCSKIGKVTGAALRGSVSSGQFNPPKPLRTPVMVSTEFGQTNFEEELLNIFLALLDEGQTNVAMNKIGNIGENQKKSIQNQWEGIDFKGNEFDVETTFIFWGATYDPDQLQDDAFRDRMKIVRPEQTLDSTVTKAADNNIFSIDTNTVTKLRQLLTEDIESEVNFTPPDAIYDKYGDLSMRESRDLQSYMASRAWWGLEVNPELMDEYLQELKESRRLARMSDEDVILDLIFDNPMTYDEIQAKTGLSRKETYQILNKLGAKRIKVDEGSPKWVISSGGNNFGEESKEKENILEGLGQ